MTSVKNCRKLFKAYQTFKKGKLPDCHEFFENVFDLSEKNDFYADLFAVLQMAEQFGLKDEFFKAASEECKVQLDAVKKSDSPFLLPCITKHDDFVVAEKLFEEKRQGRWQDIKKDLEETSGQKAEVQSDETKFDEKFVLARIDEAKKLVNEYKNDVQQVLDESFGQKLLPEEFVMQAGSKSYERVQEKIKEMIDEKEADGSNKYPRPVEKNLMDLLRGRFMIIPSRLRSDNVEDSINKIIKFLENLDKKMKITRMKNKISKLSEMMLNMQYKTLLVELQICFCQDYRCYDESHVVYDVSRLITFASLKKYFLDKKCIKDVRAEFEKEGEKAIGGLKRIKDDADDDDEVKVVNEYIAALVKYFKTP